tara:strand:- start:1736 stop:1981 length:246 start_codon:yes stop_codon:yes gene_type:complete
MLEEKKLTDEEQKKLNILNKRLYDNLLSIGDMEASIISLTKRKNIVVGEHEKNIMDMTEYKTELGRKYESSKVDMATGVLS